MGRLPQRDQQNAPCTVLAEALGLQQDELVDGSAQVFPSLVGHGLASGLPETRVGWLATLRSPEAETIFTDVAGRTCGVTLTAGAGRAAVVTAEIPAHPDLCTALLGHLGTVAGLRLRTSVPGVVVTSGVTPRGERMLHLLNPTGYDATVQVDVGDPTGLLDGPLTLPARTGRMLGVGLQLDDRTTIVSSNAEVAEAATGRIRFTAGLGQRTEVWLRTDRKVSGGHVRREGELTVVTGPAGADLVVGLA